jgi:hypothetical protein
MRSSYRPPHGTEGKQRLAVRGPIPREEYVRRVREALAADYTALRDSPLCELPGVAALARTEYSRKIYPEASALRAVLEQAFNQVLTGLEGIQDRRLQQVATYLRLVRQHAPLREILPEMGLRARSYVQAEIQPQALELLTEAFLKLARRDEVPDGGPSGEQSIHRQKVRRISPVAPLASERHSSQAVAMK